MQHDVAHGCGACAHRRAGPELDAPALLRNHRRWVGRLGGGPSLGSLCGSLALVLAVLGGASRRPLGQQWPYGSSTSQHPVQSALRCPAVFSAHCNCLPACRPRHEQFHLGPWNAGYQDDCDAAAGGGEPAAETGGRLLLYNRWHSASTSDGWPLVLAAFGCGFSACRAKRVLCSHCSQPPWLDQVGNAAASFLQQRPCLAAHCCRPHCPGWPCRGISPSGPSTLLSGTTRRLAAHKVCGRCRRCLFAASFTTTTAAAAAAAHATTTTTAAAVPAQHTCGMRLRLPACPPLPASLSIASQLKHCLPAEALPATPASHRCDRDCRSAAEAGSGAGAGFGRGEARGLWLISETLVNEVELEPVWDEVVVHRGRAGIVGPPGWPVGPRLHSKRQRTHSGSAFLLPIQTLRCPGCAAGRLSHDGWADWSQGPALPHHGVGMWVLVAVLVGADWLAPYVGGSGWLCGCALNCYRAGCRTAWAAILPRQHAGRTAVPSRHGAGGTLAHPTSPSHA